MLATHTGFGPTLSLSTHSAAPDSPFQSASATRFHTIPSSLMRARGLDFAVAMARRTVISTGADAFTRNAYHGLGLIGSFSGVIRIL